MKYNLKTEIAGIKMANPVMAASGTFGYGEEFSNIIDIKELGAIITKSVSLHPKEGNPPPRICETPSGMLNSIGLQNDGIATFLKTHLPFLSKFKVPIIVNIAGETTQEFVEISRTLSKSSHIKGFELNVSCPNVKKGGMQFGRSISGVKEIVKAVRKATELPIIVKLSPNVTNISQIALAAQSCGADAISLINTVLGMAVDVKNRQFKLSTKTGGLSGPAIKPIAVRMVWEVARVVKIPIIGIGGISTTEDALEFFLVGASAIQIGTANFIDVNSALKIIKGLKEYNLKNIIGYLG